MKKPYIKKIAEIAGFKIWYVNGYWIRKNLDPAFTNFGGHRHFEFIPKDELWIDKENGRTEAHYFIENFLAIQRELKKGETYPEAVETANKIEIRERNRSKFLKKIRKIKVKEKILKKIYKKPLFGKYTKNLKIKIVRGNLVRSLFYLDFTGGGHDKIYSFIPEDEIWIDDDVYKKERALVLIHELHERALMSKGWPYASTGQKVFTRKKQTEKRSAHFAAEGLEYWCRNHPKSIKRILLREIRENERLIKKSAQD
ncbi:hypothetical protein HY449_01930 [Candidatus Pacearchaeota archaeon]|nr:hypothetical protein [Candidatus Pacearchaeota archaeon]